jgi:hypothetical protein
MKYIPLTEKKLLEIAYQEGIPHAHLYAKFMQKRFPKESDEGYARSWARRFFSADLYGANPETFMDKKSLKIYEWAKRKMGDVI